MQQQLTLEEIQDFKGTYPKQIWSLFFSEMWERFCFYGMRGMLTFFMVYQMGMDKEGAQLQYGATQAWVYAFTFIGGLFADKILGFRKSLFWGGLLMIVGSIFLAANPHTFFFIGLSFLIVGTGFFKPNISSMVGQLYKDGDARRDVGFSLFYSGINIGAFLGGILMIGVGKGVFFSSFIPEQYRWNVAFGLVAVVMVISLLTFLFTHKNLGSIGDSPIDFKIVREKKWYEYAVYIGALCAVPLIIKMVSNTVYTDYFMYAIGPFSIAYLGYELVKNTSNGKYLNTQMYFCISLFIMAFIIYWIMGGTLGIDTLFVTNLFDTNVLFYVRIITLILFLTTFFVGIIKYCVKESQKTLAAIVFILFSVVFWAIFEQAGGSLSIYAAEHLNNKLIGVTVDPNMVNNSANSLFVILFAPLLGLIWLALYKKNLEPNGVIKFGLGFILLGLGFYVFFSGKFFATSNGIASLNVFTIAYLIVTFAEIALSPIGLSLMTKLATKKLQGFMMGMWFLASAYGQYVAGLFGAALTPKETATAVEKLATYSEGYKQFALYAIIAGVVLICLNPLIKKLMGEVK
jgi:POT family proton-dependent oligopeptide transporter